MKVKVKKHNYQDLYNSSIFTKIYNYNIWGGEKGEYFSGPGSHNEHVEGYCKTVSDFIIENNISKIVEIGCGDFNVSSKVMALLNYANLDYNYVGYDVVKKLIQRNQALFATPKIRFICKDSCVGKIESGDLLIVRQVLQHLNNKSINQIVRKFVNYKYILLTEHQLTDFKNVVPNKDMQTSGGTRLRHHSGVYIDKTPFNAEIDAMIYSIPEKSFGFNASINTFLLKPTSNKM